MNSCHQTNVIRLALMALLLLMPLSPAKAQDTPAHPKTDTIRVAPRDLDQLRQLILRDRNRGVSQRPEVAEADQLINEGHFQRAIDILEPMWRSDPTDNVVSSSLKRAYRGLKNYEGLLSVIRRQLIDQSDDGALLSEAADAYFASGDEESAISTIEQIIAVDRNDPERRRLAAKAYVRSGRYVEGIELYRQSRVELGDSLLFAEDLARLLEARREYDAAVDEYFRWLEASPTANRIVQKQLTNLTKIPEAASQITAALESIVRQSTGNEFAHRLYGDMLFESGGVDSAFAEYRRADALAENPGMHRIYGIERALEIGRNDAARTEALAFLEDHPTHNERTRVHLALARAELALGRPTVAIDLLRDLAGAIPLPREQARIYYEIGEIYRQYTTMIDSAESYYQRLIDQTAERSPEATLGWLRMGDIAVIRGDLHRADTAYVKASDHPPIDLAEEVTFKQAELMFLAGDYDAASAKLSDMIKRYPRGLYVNDAFALRMVIRDGNDAMAWSLKHYAAAEMALRQRDPDSALSLFTLLAEDSANALADDALFAAAMVSNGTKRHTDAIATLEELCERFPESFLVPKALLAIGNIWADTLANATEARSAYQKILTQYADSPTVEEARRRLQSLGVP